MQRQQFLAEASRLLTESSDYVAALESVVELAVPGLADRCVIDLQRHDGSMTCVIAPRRHTPSDSDALATPDRRHLLHRLGLQAAVCVPLAARHRLFGTITFYTAGARAFGPDDVAMVEELARRAAMAIDNARLREDARRAEQSREETLLVLNQQLLAPLSVIMKAAEIQMATAPASPVGQSLLEAAEACLQAAQQMRHLLGDLTEREERRVAAR
jgi:GAF domain-containing protein